MDISFYNAESGFRQARTRSTIFVRFSVNVEEIMVLRAQVLGGSQELLHVHTI